jgi:hypothetical protein
MIELMEIKKLAWSIYRVPVIHKQVTDLSGVSNELLYEFTIAKKDTRIQMISHGRQLKHTIFLHKKTIAKISVTPMVELIYRKYLD